MSLAAATPENIAKYMQFLQVAKKLENVVALEDYSSK